MFFSVVVPVYNVEKYLKECVDSILSQTFEDFELILVNDGSKDSSPAICDEYAKKDRRVKVIHKENGGLSDARNVGTKSAVGEYVIYIDSDDYVRENDFLQSIYDKAKNGTEIICYKFSKYFENTDTFGSCQFNFPELSENDTLAEKIIKIVKNDAFYCSAWSKSIKLSLLKENNIEFEKGLLGEDQEWYYHVLLVAQSIDGIDKDYIVYRQRANSITSSWKIKNLTDCIYLIEKWNKGINEADISDEYKNALYNSLAKLYCNLLIGYTNFNNAEKKQYLSQIKKLSHLLKYNANPRTATFSKIYKLVGFKLMMVALNILCKVKK